MRPACDGASGPTSTCGRSCPATGAPTPPAADVDRHPGAHPKDHRAPGWQGHRQEDAALAGLTRPCIPRALKRFGQSRHARRSRHAIYRSFSAVAELRVTRRDFTLRRDVVADFAGAIAHCASRRIDLAGRSVSTRPREPASIDVLGVRGVHEWRHPVVRR